MPENDLSDRLRALEIAMSGVSARTPVSPVTPDLARKFELAEKNAEAIAASGALSEKDADKFRKIADVAIKDSMREALRGGAGELAATINVTVSGTGTISTS